MAYYLRTLPPKSLHPFSSIWSKKYLSKGFVGGLGGDPQTIKWGTHFPMSIAVSMPIFNNFQQNRASAETFQ